MCPLFIESQWHVSVFNLSRVRLTAVDLMKATSVFALQIATLPETHVELNGQPNYDGWYWLKEARKAGMVRGVIGSSGLQPVPVPEEEEDAAAPSLPLPRPGLWTDADSMTDSDPISDLDMPPSEVEPDSAAQPDAAEGPSAATPPLPESHRVLPASPWQKLAELENLGRAPQEPHHLNFAGNLEAADDIAVKMQLASKGNLELMHVPGLPPRNPLHRLRYPPERAFWRWTAAGIDDDKLPVEFRRNCLCKPPGGAPAEWCGVPIPASRTFAGVGAGRGGLGGGSL
jgi:hypothetical protein